MQLQLKTPCTEDWDKMQPNNEGVYCFKCQHNVVDFTTMTDVEVQQFFINNNHQSVCGKVTNAQLQRLNIHIDERIIFSDISVWKKYLAIIIICFSAFIFSCNTVSEAKHLLSNMEKISFVKLKEKELVNSLKVSSTIPNTIWDIDLSKLNLYRGHTYGYMVSIPGEKISRDDLIKQYEDSVLTSSKDSILIPIQDSIRIIKPVDSLPLKKDTIPQRTDSCSTTIFS